MNRSDSRGNLKKLSLSIISALAAGLASTATIAQDADEIVVTGTRIRNQTGMTTPNPVTAVTFDELNDFNPGTTVAEQLDALPQFFGTTTAQRGGNSISETAGGSYLNLRGMGLNRTLVMLDNTRIIPADANGSVNIDLLPSNLLQRMDIVTGGASAAYGADAVAGVVNFILDREYEGLKMNVSGGTSQEGDGDRWTFGIAGGRSFMDGRLHFTGSFEATEIDEIDGTVEGIGNFKDWGYINNPDPNGPARITVPWVHNNNSFHTGMIRETGTSLDGMVFTEDGTGVRNYERGDLSAGNSHAGGNEYDDHRLANEHGINGNESIRRSTFLSLKYDVSDNFSITGTALIGRSESHDTNIRSNFNFSGFGSYSMTIFRDNYYLPDEVAAIMDANNLDFIKTSKVGYIPNPGTNNPYSDRHNFSVQQTESYNIGFDWNIDDNWSLTGVYQEGESKVSTGIRNVARIDKFFMSMDVIDDGFGNPTCRVTAVNPTPAELAASVDGVIFASALSLDGVTADSPVGPFTPSECVPWNVMGNGNASQEAVDWIINDQERKHIRLLNQDFAEFVLSGQIYEGWGAGPIAMAAGLTWRDETFDRFNSPLYSERGVRNRPEVGIQGISAGFAGAGNRSLFPFSALGAGGGEGDVTETFVQFDVPVIELDSGQRLTSTWAYRNSDYSNSGNTPSWKIGFELQLTEDLRWRYTRSHDVREPNFGERYLVSTGGATVRDDALPAPLGGDGIVITSLAGGNPNLAPEEADTVTTGFVYRPTFAPWIEGLQVSVDWYEIDMTDAVDTYGTQRIIDDCFATNDPVICALVERSPTNGQMVNGQFVGQIERVINSFQNVAKAQNRGIDIEAQYSTNVNFFDSMDETLTIRAFGGHLSENSTTSISGNETDDVGTRDRADYSGTLSANYRLGDIGVGLTGIYYGDTLINENWTSGVDIDNNKIASQTIFNMNVSYGQEMARGGEWRATFTVSNLFDRDAPIIPTATGQTWSNSHDQFGRRFQAGVRMTF